MNYSNLDFSLNDIIYFSEESILYKGKFFHNTVCTKEMNINYLSEKEQDKIQTEVMISLQLHHKSMINTLGYCFNQHRITIFIITEFMKNKSLKLFIEPNKGNIPLKQKLLFIYEKALGLEFMYNSNSKIMYRDIKSSNILLDYNPHCKICDFGMSKFFNLYNNSGNNSNNMSSNYQTNSQSTLFWMSPEYLCDGLVNDKCDIYSF